MGERLNVELWAKARCVIDGHELSDVAFHRREASGLSIRGRRDYHQPGVQGIGGGTGYPWSVRLKAALPLWLPWARRHQRLSARVCAQLQGISPRQIDRRLAKVKRTLKRRQYGRTRPGTLLKHHIPLKTDHWDVTTSGFTELDLVAHCGHRADGEFAHSLNVTDIHTTWVETRAVLGKAEVGVQQALEAIRHVPPFRLRGIDSDNGSEFINAHLYRYCQAQEIQFTRGRPAGRRGRPQRPV